MVQNIYILLSSGQGFLALKSRKLKNLTKLESFVFGIYTFVNIYINKKKD